MTPTITFRAPGLVPYTGGCVTEPAFFALDYLVHYRSDMQVGEQRLHEVNVLETLRAVLADPAAHGLSRTDAEAARERFLEQAGQALVAQGGQVAWLEKEFER
ncbi:hypothetical protein [Deinococcus alpinitundrae]|uniref:hypothetical protein n=1 Tax=Deinococcus alpinitundrae TaxID=468913 RepID=UPI00137AC70E|nr:hypothetical protein [Deinococcus alpinitundrae]